MIELVLESPTRTVKRLVGEEVVVRARLRAENAPEELLVEAWGSLHDRSGQQEMAHSLEFVEEVDGWKIFEGSLEAIYTGDFLVRVRARAEQDKRWVWADESFTAWVDPSYVKDAVVYNAFVRYFGGRVVEEGGEVERVTGGTFEDLREELVNLKELGVDVLYLNPIHMIGEVFRNYNPHDLLPEYLQPGCPYSIKDYKSVDQELSFGDKGPSSDEHPFAEFRKFVNLAHGLGLRVYLDLVFNHSAHDAVFQRSHPEWFLYKEDILSLEEPYIYPHELSDGKPWGDAKHTFSPFDHGHWWKDTAQLNWNNVDSYPEFVMPQVSENPPPKNPTIDSMYDYFVNIAKFWVREFGIDGFRCDVAYRVPKDFWTRCIQEVREVAKRAHPSNGSINGDIVFIAEDYHVDLKGLLEAGFTAVYGDFSNMMHSLPQLTSYLDFMYGISSDHLPDGSLFFTFPECHDFHRNPSKIAQQFRDDHLDADLNANMSRWVLTATLPGMPMIFNGFEKMEWQPASLFSYSAVDWESDKDIREYIRLVNGVRASSVALRRGRYHYLHTSEGVSESSKLMSFARVHDEELVFVCTNLHVAEETGFVEVFVPEDLGVGESFVLVDLLSGERYEHSGSSFSVRLAPGESHVFLVE